MNGAELIVAALLLSGALCALNAVRRHFVGIRFERRQRAVTR
jgi:hypothetical protein